MREKQNQFPYKSLGTRLKGLRQKMQESLAEVSGAVEIEVGTLSEIEEGSRRPSEEILLLIISHFAVKDDEATQLWELAGYDQKTTNTTSASSDNHSSQAVMVLPSEPRIIYTDLVHILVNNYGVIMNFMQDGGNNNQPITVSRVGMSKEHAQSVLELLQQTLASNDPKALPASDTSSDKQIKN